MMNISNVVVIVLSLVSLLFSVCASAGALIASQSKMKMKRKAAARKASRIEVPLEEIMDQLGALPEEHEETVFQVKGIRIFQSHHSESNNNKLAI